MAPLAALLLALGAAPVAAAAPLVEGAPNTRPIVLGDDAPACAPGAREPAIRLRVVGLRAHAGFLRAELYPANDADFLKPDRLLEAEGKPFRRAWVAVPAAGPAEICLRAPQPGTYAVSVVHLDSPRWKFDLRRDGAGFTNNPRLGLGKPKAARVATAIGPRGAEATIVMNYLQGLAFRPLARPAQHFAEARD
ncbi:DUF2141 domain-containing protein [Thermaurantiacus sp.]